MFEYKKHKIAICIIAIILHLTLFLAPIFQSRTLTVCDVPYTVYEPLYTTVPQIVGGKMEQVQIQIGTIPKTEYKTELVWQKTEPKSLIQLAIDGPIPVFDGDSDNSIYSMFKFIIYFAVFFTLCMDISALRTFTVKYTKDKLLQDYINLLTAKPSFDRSINKLVKNFFRAPSGMFMLPLLLLPINIGLADNIYSATSDFPLPDPLLYGADYVILGILVAIMILSIYNRIISKKQTDIFLDDLANERAKLHEEE